MKLILEYTEDKIFRLIHADKQNHKNPENTINLQYEPWPIEENSVDEFFLNTPLNNLGQQKNTLLSIAKEIYRICKDNTCLHINFSHRHIDHCSNAPDLEQRVAHEFLSSFSKENCIDWAIAMVPNSPLALEHNFDFEITKITRSKAKKITPQNQHEANKNKPFALTFKKYEITSEYKIKLKVIKNTEQNLRYTKKLHEAASELISQNKLEQTLGLCKIGLQLVPSHPGLAFLAGEVAIRSGDISNCIALAQSVTKSHADDPTPYWHLGNIYQRIGRFDSAMTQYEKAIKLDHNYAPAHLGLGEILYHFGDMDLALEHSVRATEIQPDTYEAYYLCGKILVTLQNIAIALECFKKAEMIIKDIPGMSYFKGLAYMTLDNPKLALQFFDLTICNSGKYLAEAFLQRAKIFALFDKKYSSIKNLLKAIKIDPLLPEAMQFIENLSKDQNNTHATLNLRKKIEIVRKNKISEIKKQACELINQKEYKTAVSILTKTIQIEPFDYELYTLRSDAYRAIELYDECINDLKTALSINSSCSTLHFFLGNAYLEKMSFHEAISCYKESISKNANIVLSYLNLGVCYQALNKIKRSMASYNAAINLEPSFSPARFNRAIINLLTGNLKEGFREYEYRELSPELFEKSMQKPLWRGQDLTGKSVLVLGEQGLGDNIQYYRFLKHLITLGATVTLQVQGPLIRFFSEMNGAYNVISVGDSPPHHDYFCPIMSLPHYLGTTLKTIPRAKRYLSAGDKNLEKWKKIMGPKTKPRIGLAWRGNPSHKNDRNRSIPLDYLSTLISEDYEFISLVKSFTPETDEFPEKFGIKDFSSKISDFSDTASICENLDLIISVDTSLAHLGGALGIPTWVLLPFAPDWRWLLKRKTSPWYPSIRLYRQKTISDWNEPLARLKADLKIQLPPTKF